MKKFIVQLFNRAPVPPEPEDTSLPELPAAGQIYSFRTKPYCEFSPSQTGRYAAFKVLGANSRLVSVAVLEGVWRAAPSLKEVRRASIIKEYRFAHTGQPAQFGVNRDWWQLEQDLDEISFVGTLSVSAADKAIANAISNFEVGTSRSTLHHADYTAEGEWRWANDRDAFVAEIELRDAKNAAERVAKEERYRSRLKNLTWVQLLSETPFERWCASPPYPPDEFTAAARKVIREVCITLRDLGPKPRKGAVRTVLKNAVQWFNDADENAGFVIETEEREDICALLEEIAYVARQKSLVEEIDEWRNW